MRIAVPYKDGEIFEHFGHTEMFAVYEYEGADVTKCTKRLIETGDRHGHKDMAELLDYDESIKPVDEQVTVEGEEISEDENAQENENSDENDYD